MGSLMTSTLRTQAHAVFLASRAHLAVGAARSFGLIASRRAQNMPSFARALSSSQVLSAEDVTRERKECPANPPNKTIVMGSLSKSMKDVENQIEQYLTTFGPIVSIRMSTRPNGSFTGSAHIEFANIADAMKVFEAHTAEPLFIAGRTVRIKYANLPYDKEALDDLFMEIFKLSNARIRGFPSHTLSISNFPHGEAILRECFDSFKSDIVGAYLLRDKKGSDMGSGHVEFSSISRATEALDGLDGKTINGHVLRISFAELRSIPREPRGRAAGGTSYHTLFISDFPHWQGKASLQKCFDSFGSDIISAYLRVDRTDKRKGSGFVEFNDSSKAAEALHEFNGQTFNGHMLNISFALPPDPRERRRGRAVADTPQHQLYISDFPRDDASLRDCFDSFKSDIVSIYLLRDETGKSKGSGFIVFNSISKATEALHELDGKTIDRRRLDISFARPPKPYHTLCISDFPHGEASLRECFHSFKSDIVGAYLPRDKQGKSKSHGFVEFNGISKATEALDELGGKTINGHMLKISFAQRLQAQRARGHAVGGGGRR